MSVVCDSNQAGQFVSQLTEQKADAIAKVLTGLLSHNQWCNTASTRLDVAASTATGKGGGALCAGNAVALLVFGPVMP